MRAGHTPAVLATGRVSCAAAHCRPHGARADVAPCARLFAAGQQEIEPRTPCWSADEFAGAGRGRGASWSPWPGNEVSRASVSCGGRTPSSISSTSRRRGVGAASAAACLRRRGPRSDGPLELKCLVRQPSGARFLPASGLAQRSSAERRFRRTLCPAAPARAELSSVDRRSRWSGLGQACRARHGSRRPRTAWPEAATTGGGATSSGVGAEPQARQPGGPAPVQEVTTANGTASSSGAAEQDGPEPRRLGRQAPDRQPPQPGRAGSAATGRAPPRAKAGRAGRAAAPPSGSSGRRACRARKWSARRP